MKMKNLVAFAMLALGVVAAPSVAFGKLNAHIRSIDSAPDYGQSISYPNKTAPLKITQELYILVRLLNEDWDVTKNAGKAPHPWYFKPHSAGGYDPELLGDEFQPALGISIGGRTDRARYVMQGPNGEESGKNPEKPWYTDLYFKYTVKPSDLGLPVKLLNREGRVVEDEPSNSGFKLYNVNTAGDEKGALWDLTNDVTDEDDKYTLTLAGFLYCPDGDYDPDDPDAGKYDYPSKPYTTPHRSFFEPDPGIYVQTVDFDAKSVPQEETDLTVWRWANADGVYRGDLPGIIGETNSVVYVWCEDESVAIPAPDASGSSEYVTDEEEPWRHVLKVSVRSGTTTFELKGVGSVSATTKVYLSSSMKSGISKVGDKLESSTVSRMIRVAPPSDPFMSITTFGDKSKEEMTAVVDPELGRLMMKVSVNKAWTNETESLTIALNPKFRDIDLATADPTNGYVRILTKETDPTRAAGTNAVTIAPGQTSATFYIYALGSLGNASRFVDFTPTVVGNAAAAAYYNGDNKPFELKLKDQAPDIIQPAEGMVYNGREGSVIDGFDVEVADNWRDLQTALATNGYEIVVEGTGVEKFTTNGVHFTDGAVVTLPVRVSASGTALTATVKVKDPAGNVSTREVTINSTPKPKARVQFYADRNLTQPLAGNTFNEGEVPYVGIVFTEGKASANMYAFFVPTDANATNLVECDAKTNGLKIAFGDTNSTVTAMAFLDGFTQVNPMKAKFAIRFLSTPTIGGEGTPIDYTDDCGSPTFEVNAVNVSPIVDQVFLDGGGITDGESFNKVPSGIEKLYSAIVLDPSRIDLKYGAGYEGREVWVRWEYTDDYEGWETARANYAYSTNGTDGAEVRLSFTYENTLQRVRLYALDKDDRAAQGTSDPKKLNWGKPLFTFYVDVAPTQRIIISDQNKTPLGEDGELVYLEDQKQSTGVKGDFYISLSEIPGRPYEGQKAQPIRVRLTLEQWGDGVLNIHTNYVYFKSNEKKEQPIRIDTATLNGGQASDWTLTAEVDMEDPTAKDSDGNPWSEHFAPAYAEVYVRNVDPVIDSAVAKGSRSWSDTVTNTVAAGDAITVNWRITDITNDFCQAYDPYDWKYDNFQIEWSVDSADTVKYPNPQVITNGWQRNKGNGTKGQIYGDYTFNVPARDGYSRITMTVSDGDGGFATKEWWIYVSPAKRLKVDVFGPKSTAQTKYKAAKGVGQGLVAAKGVLALCEQFVQTWEYDEVTKDAELCAYGYPATNTWAQFLLDYGISPTTVSATNTFDQGKIPSYLNPGSTWTGVPLNKLGNRHTSADTTWYDWATHGDRDATAGAYDSFFYRWMLIKAAKSDSGTGGAEWLPAPTVWPFDSSTATFDLDSGDNQKTGTGAATYGTVEVEAIFSKELRPKDNLGDINADGIPDKVVELYGFGANVGEYPEDDLASLSAYNDDEDFLPNTAGSAIYSSLIPGLPGSWGEGQEFTAVMEVRGAYADEGVSGLNDGAHLVGLSQQKLEPGFYSDDVELRKAARDYSALEMMAWAEHGYAKDWSPERPTDPTKADTDEDKFPDGYEYYFWYKAHVGYIENGVHRYLTGRVYDPKNPGEGKFLPAAVIARLMDPRSDLAAVDIPETAADRLLLTELLATNAKTRDTDNDGLPDALEFELGTNPFDFDTDGDGLPDGFEIMLGGTDPLLAETTPGISDAMRNFDGDAMAFTTPFLEANGFVLPVPLVVDTFLSFALVDPEGDTDGIQWYVSREWIDPSNVVASAETRSGISFTLAGDTNVTYVTSLGSLPVADGRLACDLLKSQVRTMIATNDDFGVEGELNVALMPVMIPAGTPVTNVSEAAVEYRTLTFKEDVKGVNAAWVYGRSINTVTTGENLANMGGFGMLTIARYQDAKAGFELAALPEQDDDVAYLHHFVYQEFGFDPRTAWNANTPLAPRWGKTVETGDEEAKETEIVANNFLVNYGYAGIATRSREYTLYDEFLVMSFFLNNGKLTMADVTPTQTFPWEKIWSKYTTNGQGPREPNWETDNDHYKGRTAETNSGENGADTDMDGVPDGWELYVMAGPKLQDKETKKFFYNLVAPYNDGFYSSFGPFVGDAAKVSMTDNGATGGRSSAGGDEDGLTELQEYAGTDSCDYYSGLNQGAEDEKYAYSTTIVRPKEHEAWLNKFFPTDPWNPDTDGDGLKDNESEYFKYGKPVDDGKSTCIPGGGLNPLSVDTDMDGLPDPWELAFKGQTVYSGEDAQKPKDKDGNEVADGNVLQGYCDGMDGTVWDPYTSPHVNTADMSGDTLKAETLVVSLNGVDQVVDRDYDHDGLENWQEYLTGAMRVWRYDDPVTQWSYIPDSAYFNPLTGEFDLTSAMAYTGSATADEFWYKTLFDRTSKYYNPHFVTGTSPCSQYFSRVTNGWDMVFTEAGTYYMFPDHVGPDSYKVIWGKDYYGVDAGPTKYICTSPILADTDQDGMDDYYELFHGMNPLLGLPGVLSDSSGPYDVVYDAWGKNSPITATANLWMKTLPANGDYDYIAHPWLNGIVDADPDGDDIRNQDEAIMPLVAPSTSWYHTDPTPLWMTDSSWSGSLVYRFFRMPICLNVVPVPPSIEYKGKKYSLIDCDGFIGDKIAPFFPDYWLLAEIGAANWMYSFEENEGYDTDHDAGSDTEELQGKFRNRTDPQDADSPRRRQAMYFGGPEDKSALQTMPFVSELYPRAAMGYPDDMSFLQYTVECWVWPESSADATVIERTSFTDPSHVADERYVRRNFTIGIRNGKWYTAFDSNGTLDGSVVDVQGKTDAKVGAWTYVAATYDANRLTLYVNGNEDGYVLSNLKPEYGSAAVITYPAGTSAETTNGVISSGTSLEALMGDAHAYWYDAEYALNAFLVGASFANATDGNHLDLTRGLGWGRYHSFFKGWVDEIRVWDGARSADDIAADFSSRKRYTREDALANRSSFYNKWSTGKLRYRKDGDGRDLDVMPELRFHWTFDSIPGAENAASVAVAPHGFLDGPKAPWSSPSDYSVPWWSGVVGAYGSVYEGERNWVPWIPNTVTHLPRFDLTTIDSAYWSENYAGDKAGTYKFARTMEPVSKWTQMVRNMTDKSLLFQTTGRRFWLSHNTGTNTTSTLPTQFEFTGRHLNQVGDDLLPLGGAFARYVDKMWDDQGASSVWEQTGNDADNDGLADWWQEYAEQNYREGVPEGEDITWTTMIWYEVGGVKIRMTAGEAYQRDLAKGAYVDANGEVRVGPTAYAQTAKSDGMIPDWWKELKKIDGEDPLSDLDNDGLSTYVEYVASELLPFQLNLDPRMAKSDTETLDYFRRIGKLYLGEMLTDHDQMEDHWERSLDDPTVADATVWDALKDAEEDGWNNFAENRYNGYAMSTLAQLVSHAVGDGEVLDAPIPSIKLKVRYNGDRPLADKEAEGDAAMPALVVRAFSRSGETGDYVLNPDAVWSVRPGETVEKEVYLGGWEDRVVRGTMAPGNVDLGTLDIKFAQVPQSDLYSWTDESGTHISRPYAEFKEALDKDPDIIQNIQNFEWLSLYAPANEYTSADRAVTVTRDKLTQKGSIAVYGEPVGTIDLTTGDFEFDMAAMNSLRYNYTYDGGKGPAAAWGYKEAIFKITYSATVPSAQSRVIDVSLAKADSGFVRGGDNSFEAFYDLDDSGTWDPGEPFGVMNGVEIGWASRDVEIELTDMSAVTPRVKLWGAGGEGGASSSSGGSKDDKAEGRAAAADSDRGVRVGTATFEAGDDARFEITTAPAPKSRVRVVRYKVDKFPVYKVGVKAGVVLEKDFEETSRDFLHEGDFLADGDLDIDWENLYTDVVGWRGALDAACQVTNVIYLIVYNWDAASYATDDDTNTLVKANATLVTRRFEKTRSVPTSCPERAVYNQSRPTFAWKIENEDKWASWFGTTYTAFKVRVKDESGKTLVYDSDIRRLPAKDANGVYTWTAPLYVGEKVPGTGVTFSNLTTYTWEVAVYNAKFKTDDLMTIQNRKLVTGNPFSKAETFRMNVTDLDASSSALAVRVCYAGPATKLAGRVRAEAFTSPDFSGDPVAAVTLGDASALSPAGTVANARMIGLPAGKYFVRAYIDTNQNGVHDDWESWGYLSERDLASKPGIFNPVALGASVNPSVENVRKVLIEDCDTDGDWFPDVWEAEQNGDKFDRTKVAPVKGDAELIGVNTNLDANLTKAMQGLSAMRAALNSVSGVSLMTGVKQADVKSTVNGGFVIKSEVKSETLTIVGLSVDTANGRVLLKVGAETTANVDPMVANFLNITVRKGAEVTVKVEHAESPNGPWTELKGVGGTVTVDRAGSDIEVKLDGELPAQGYFRAKIEE